MEKRKSCAKVLSLILFCLLFSGNAHAFVIDGLLGDWGVAPGAFGGSDWIPDSGILYKEEDQNTHYLGPGFGGQKFDAEAIYGARSDEKFYLAIVAGMGPEGWNGEYPGDIFINFGAGRTYGIKTIGSDKGKIYKNPLWNASPYWAEVDETTMIGGSGSELGLIDSFFYGYTYPDETDFHYVMELAVDKSFFGNDWMYGGRIRWTETCGNDYIDLDIPQTPEPMTLSLLGMGLFGLAGLKRRK